MPLFSNRLRSRCLLMFCSALVILGSGSLTLLRAEDQPITDSTKTTPVTDSTRTKPVADSTKTKPVEQTPAAAPTKAVPKAAKSSSEDESSDLLEVVLSGGLLVPGGGIKNFGDSLGAKTGWGAGAQIGFFVTPELTIGVDLSFSRLGVDNPNLNSARHQYLGAMIYGKYFFFGDGKLAPFVKGMAGIQAPKYTTIVYSSNEARYRTRELAYDPAPAFGASVGLLALTSDNGGVFLEAGYLIVSSSKARGKYQGKEYEFGENGGLFTLRAGFDVFFGS